jgi:hypothetical protein
MKERRKVREFRKCIGFFAGIVITIAGQARAQEPVRLQEGFPEGCQYHVSCLVEVNGNLTIPAEKEKSRPQLLPVKGKSIIEYDERVLTVGKSGHVDKTLRIYRKMDFQRTVRDQAQEGTIRPEVRRLVILRLNQVEVPFSPDGPLTWGEIDLVRTDVFTPALTGLLPSGPVKTGDKWPAATSAVQELTDMERIDQGQVECRLTELMTIQNRRHARVQFSGTVAGLNEDGPNRQRLEGAFFFDLESNHIASITLNGISMLLDKDGKEVGRVEGQFTLTRQLSQRSRDLSDESIRGMILEPTDENTRLLYDNRDLGLRFLFPRRWKVMGVRGRQLAVDDTEGNGMMLTLEPASKAPSGAQYLRESVEWLEKQKVKITVVDPVRRVGTGSGELEHFALNVEMPKEKVVMDYYVVRQSLGGVTLAARLLPGVRLAETKKAVESIAKSVVLTGKISE